MTSVWNACQMTLCSPLVYWHVPDRAEALVQDVINQPSHHISTDFINCSRATRGGSCFTQTEHLLHRLYRPERWVLTPLKMLSSKEEEQDQQSRVELPWKWEWWYRKDKSKEDFNWSILQKLWRSEVVMLLWIKQGWSGQYAPKGTVRQKIKFSQYRLTLMLMNPESETV